MRHLLSAGSMILAVSLALAWHGAGAQAPALGTWAKKAPMRFARSELQAAAVDGKIYVVGGGRTDMRDGKPFENQANGDTDEYDPKADSWRVRTPMPEGGTHNSIAVLDGKIYIAGGFAGRQHTLPTASVYSYDPAADTWRKLASLSGPRAAISLAAVDGKVHAIGGRVMGEETTIPTHEDYDPTSDSSRPAAPLPPARDHPGVWTVDGKIHLFGGRTGGSEFVRFPCRMSMTPRPIRGRAPPRCRSACRAAPSRNIAASCSWRAANAASATAPAWPSTRTRLMIPRPTLGA